MRITSKGQVTIPQAIREAAGFMPETEVEFELVDGEVRIVKAGRARKRTRGQLVVDLLRSNPGEIKLSTDEIMALTRGDD